MYKKVIDTSTYIYESISTLHEWEFGSNIDNFQGIINPPKDPFYNSLEWKFIREKVFNFYGKRCMRCQTHTKIIQVDHIYPKSMYPRLALEFDNLQVLCMPCNRSKGVSIVDYRQNNKKIQRFAKNVNRNR